MNNYDTLIGWIEKMGVPYVPVPDKKLCFVTFKSKRFDCLEHTASFAVGSDDILLGQLEVTTPRVDNVRWDNVRGYLEEINMQSDSIFEWWMNDFGQIFVSFVKNMSELTLSAGKVPLLYLIVEYLLEEVDICYLELVGKIVQPLRNMNDPYSMMQFMKESILSSNEHVRLYNEELSWSADRFKGRLLGFVWALVDARKAYDLDLSDIINHQQLLIVAENHSSSTEWEIVKRLRHKISVLSPDNRNQDLEYGKWEGVAVFYLQLPLMDLCEEKDIMAECLP